MEQPDDVIVRIASTGICGSDLYEVLGPFLDPGDILGHEAMGIVEEVGPKAAQWATGLLLDPLAQPFMQKAGLDRLGALYAAIDSARRGGTVSLSGLCGGAMNPLPLLRMFDKQIQFRMDQASAGYQKSSPPHRQRRPRRGRLRHASPAAGRGTAGIYAAFQAKRNGMIKTLLHP